MLENYKEETSVDYRYWRVNLDGSQELRPLSEIGGSVGIGSPVSGGTPDSVLYIDASGNLAEDGDFVRGTNGAYFGVSSQIAVGKDVRFVQDMDLFGIGIDGVLNAYSDNGFGSSFLGTLAGDFTGTGGETNSMIIGYQSFVGGAASNINLSYDDVGDIADMRIETSTLASQARISFAAGSTPGTGEIEIDFGGTDRYRLPNTQPSAGEVLGYVSANQLGWVAVGAATIEIGAAIVGGTANRILYENSTNTLQESSDLGFIDSTGQFHVSFGGSNHLLINPASDQYYIGDGGGTGNTTLIEILDGTPLIRNWVAGQFLVQQPNAGASLIDGNTTTFNLYMGDVGTVANGTCIELLDSIKNINIKVHTSGGAGGLLKAGDTNSDGNDTMWQLDDFSRQTFVQTNGDFGVQTSLGQRALNINVASGVGQWYGEFGANALGNGTRYGWNDASEELLLRGVHINTPLMNDYADNAAAITAGLAVGDLYYTTSGTDGIVKRVI